MLIVKKKKTRKREGDLCKVSEHSDGTAGRMWDETASLG